jgi:integrase
MPNHDIKRAFFFGLFSGLRISDIKRLQYKNILFLDGEYILSIQMKKTKTQIYNYLNPIVAELLGDRGKGSDLVFPNLPSSTSAINSALKRWANHAGIKSHVTSHVARVSFATLLLQKSGNIYAVKEALGHSDINCTMNAYAHIKPTQMKQATKLAGISISLKPDASNCA